ncbi:MAG: ATP-binding protein [Gammaproteobacteria bacterium]|nr:ATP-binding protein [Gammaproteobacteria bacterium]
MSHEREQAKWRIVIGSLAFTHFIFAPQTELSHLLPPQLISGLFLLYALLNGLSLKLRPSPCNLRRRINMLMDLGATSLVIGSAGEAGTPLIAIYLWVIMGNGFRYGVGELRHAAAIGLFGFALVVLLSDFWSKHLFFSSGFLIVLFAIPYYMSKLIGDLHQAIENATRANRAKSEFLSNISHDLRTPLNGITGMNDMLAETDLNQEQRECCEVIHRSAQSLLELIERLLVRAQIEAGKQQISERAFDLDELLADLSGLFKKRTESKNLRYLCQMNQDVPKQLHGDPQLLKQILNNLLGNALKFTQQGHIEINISLRQQKPKHALIRFEINDTGIGISKTNQQKIFERFQQANDEINSRYGGNGLGMTIVKENIETMGGTLGLESTENVGSHFWFELDFEVITAKPKKRHLVKSEPMPFSIEAYQQAKNPHLKLEILAADDNELNRTIIKKILQRAGHHVTLVNDGSEALEALEQQGFDLAILDINMNHLGGLDVLKTHRFKYPNDSTPMLMLSADATELTVNRCLTAGAAYYLTKPIDSKRLLDAINSSALKSQQTTSIFKIQTEGALTKIALLNSQTLAELSSIDPHGNFVADLMQGFQHDGDKLLEKVHQSLHTPIDFISFKNGVHALKGNAAELGADKLFKFCQQAEKTSLRELHQQKNQALYNELEQLYRETLAAFKQHAEESSAS